MSTWTQPVCATCWQLIRPGVPPIRLNEPERETCCLCGEVASDGIYIRADPATVPHPRPDPEGET